MLSILWANNLHSYTPTTRLKLCCASASLISWGWLICKTLYIRSLFILTVKNLCAEPCPKLLFLSSIRFWCSSFSIPVQRWIDHLGLGLLFPIYDCLIVFLNPVMSRHLLFRLYPCHHFSTHVNRCVVCFFFFLHPCLELSWIRSKHIRSGKMWGKPLGGEFRTLNLTRVPTLMWWLFSSRSLILQS